MNVPFSATRGTQMPKRHVLSLAVAQFLALSVSQAAPNSERLGATGLRPAATANGVPLTVNSIADDGDGLCDSTPGGCTLRDALTVANSDPDASLIAFDSSVFSGAQTITLTQGQLPIIYSTTITGPGSGLLTIDAKAASRHFFISDGDGGVNQDVVISGLTLTDGSADKGGAIYARENLSLSDVTVTSNTAGTRGGGIDATVAAGGTLNLTDSSITGNLSSDNYGGAFLSVDGTGTLDLEGVTISGNTAQGGFRGGAYLYAINGAAVTIDNSTISQNLATTDGDSAGAGGLALYLGNASLEMADTVVNGNSVASGVACVGAGMTLYATSSTLSMSRVSVQDNSAGSTGSRGAGGGIGFTFYFSDVVVSDSTVSGNSAAGTAQGERKGGGMWGSANGGSLTLNRDTLSGNFAGEDGGALVLYGVGDAQVSVAASTIAGNTAAGGDGGAVVLRLHDTSQVVFSNSTVSGNTAAGHGGGAYVLVTDPASVHFDQSTITGNTADSYANGVTSGGGLFASGDGALSVHASVVAGNFDLGSAPAIDVGDNGVVTLGVSDSLIGDNSGSSLAEAPLGAPDANNNLIGDPTGAGVIDPLLGPLTDNGGPTMTHYPFMDSPLIDHYGGCSGRDQRGARRGVDGDGIVSATECDTGAVEVGEVPIFADGFEI
jgi:CSLREA domain-containing protein